MDFMNKLYELLGNLRDLHAALLTLAVEKKEVLIAGNTDGLVRIMQKEQKLVKAIEAVEAARIQCIEKLLSERSYPITVKTLDDLIKMTTSAEEKSQLTAHREELLRIVSELRAANDLNQQLLAQSLSFVEMSLDFITAPPEDDYIYHKPNGQLSGGYTQYQSYLNKKA
ncbi:flagellar protein FlgN [Brevibacillus fluminis]|uniref:flagellar protein FlgN n=1 Tax=Brevibacillus fluminis TaxID=511487 RepID=UPI003F89316A